ncbi:MAG: GAF domain-containing sensor histidine kinase [Bacteroidales bacterium]|nr:GAF domain-containing sensor histidine kinase [Bacteroidales bacterium]
MEIEQLLKREQLAKEICAQLNNFVDLKNILKTIIGNLKEITGFKAVAIRLHENNDYPYFVSKGFSNGFIKHENSLYSTSADCCNGLTKTVPECLCGNVISRKTDASLGYYTPKGSYYTNSTSKATPTLLRNETGTHIRNFCNTSGYESVGLFPIKTRDENIGLIQLNDPRSDMFSEGLVEFIEMIGEQIGVAIENATLYEKLKAQNSELQNTIDKLNNAHGHLLEAKMLSIMAELVTGLNHEIYQPVNESLVLLEKQAQFLDKPSGTTSTNDLESLLTNRNEIIKKLSIVKGLIKSYKAVSYEQFGETRHLINLRDFFNDVVQVVRPSLRNKNTGFSIDCNEHTEIMTYSGVLSKVLHILIRNSDAHAFKNSQNNLIKLSCSVSSDYFIINYIDNGSGIDLQIQHKIFEPFFTTDKKNHAGLGLHIATLLVNEKLKGKLELDKAYSGGAGFLIKIPF